MRYSHPMAMRTFDLKLSDGPWTVAEVEVIDSRNGQAVHFERLSPTAIAVDADLADWVTIRIGTRPQDG